MTLTDTPNHIVYSHHRPAGPGFKTSSTFFTSNIPRLQKPRNTSSRRGKRKNASLGSDCTSTPATGHDVAAEVVELRSRLAESRQTESNLRNRICQLEGPGVDHPSALPTGCEEAPVVGLIFLRGVDAAFREKGSGRSIYAGSVSLGLKHLKKL